MKVGIITYWDTEENYGQVLQAFALQQYLRNSGHDPFLIRYRFMIIGEKPSFKWYRVFVYLAKLPKYVIWYLNERKRQRSADKYKEAVKDIDRKFDEFKEKYVKHTEEIYDKVSIYQNPPLADAFICGSDQIWGGEGAYYLDFAPDDKPKLAYAPSLGGIISFTKEYEVQMSNWLKRFAFVGMRESTGVEVCNRLGRSDAVQVIDPTLLLDRSTYDNLRIPTKTDKPYLLLYVLGNPMSCSLEEIMAYAKKRGLEVRYVASSGQGDKYEHIYPQIGEWLDLIAKADMVITNSFHGTVFSILFERPFANIPLNAGFERMNTRCIELLHAVGLDKQIYCGSLDDIPTHDIEFAKFRVYREQEEARSRKYIAQYIPLK